MAFFRPLLQFLDILDDLLSHKAEGIIEHLFRLWLFTGHLVKTHEHLTDSDGHIERARHILPPRPRSVCALEFEELTDGTAQTVLHKVLVEEVCQTLFLFGLVIGIEHPGRFIEQELFQILVLSQGTGQ